MKPVMFTAPLAQLRLHRCMTPWIFSQTHRQANRQANSQAHTGSVGSVRESLGCAQNVSPRWCGRVARTLVLALLSGGLSLATMAPARSAIALPLQRLRLPAELTIAPNNFTPPQDLGAPGRREGAASRGNPPRPLVPAYAMTNPPPGEPTDLMRYGKTYRDRPELYVYLPTQFLRSGGEIQIGIFTDGTLIADQIIDASTLRPLAEVRVPVSLAENPNQVDVYAVVALPLPVQTHTGTPLTVAAGQTYGWLVQAFDPRSQDWSAQEGIIQGVALDPQVEAAIAAAPPDQKLDLLAQQGLWYDLVAAFVAQPQDEQAWRSLLSPFQGFEALLQGSWTFPER